MRRQIRPFTVERKRSGRPVALGEAPLLDLPPSRPEPVAPKSADVPRWAAAEALFSMPAPEAREQTAASDEPAPGGRILPSLVEPPPPVLAPSYDVDEAPRRRGRKPGSGSKTTRARAGEQGPKTIENVMRNLFEFWAREDDCAEAPAPVASTPTSAPDAAPAAPISLRRRGRITREELPRAQRWKARLPRFAR
ncbi:MAG: hypothetical protein ACK4MV_01630 [Beijerinckiaceae bacterium]